MAATWARSSSTSAAAWVLIAGAGSAFSTDAVDAGSDVSGSSLTRNQGNLVNKIIATMINPNVKKTNSIPVNVISVPYMTVADTRFHHSAITVSLFLPNSLFPSAQRAVAQIANRGYYIPRAANRQSVLALVTTTTEVDYGTSRRISTSYSKATEQKNTYSGRM